MDHIKFDITKEVNLAIPIPEMTQGIYRDMPKFVVGQLVRHKIFGLGRVRDVVDMGEDSIIVIKFNTGQTKSLMLKYADLTEP